MANCDNFVLFLDETYKSQFLTIQNMRTLGFGKKQQIRQVIIFRETGKSRCSDNARLRTLRLSGPFEQLLTGIMGIIGRGDHREDDGPWTGEFLLRPLSAPTPP